MKSAIKSDKIITHDGIKCGYIAISDGNIEKICTALPEGYTEFDYTGCYISAGFIDLHTHGGMGYPFLTKDEKDVASACDFHLSHGTTTILPTLSASPIGVLKESVEAIKKARDGKLTKANIVGAHLEGPYLSKEQCGAQAPGFITKPIKEEYAPLIDELGDAIARWTYAPENDDNGEFAKYLKEHGIIASIGHSNAKGDDVKTAVKNGANLITHLYSCTSTITRDHGYRSLGVIESSFLLDDLYVELIADGSHLPIDLVKMIVKIKGIERTALITDSLEIAGTDIREGVMASTPFIVEDGVCKLLDRSAFAGSVATADVLLRFAVQKCGFSIEDACYMLTETPAKILGINAGKIDTGYRADLVVLDEALEVRDVFVLGEKI